MSRHSASFEVERPVPAEVAQELLPRPDIKSEAALPAPLPAAPLARNGAIRRILLAGTALALLAGAAWYGWDYWTVRRCLVSTDDAYVKAGNTTTAPKVSGYLCDVVVGDEERLERGQALAGVDDRSFILT